MDYNYNLKKAWQIVKKHRYLWGIGFLAAFTEGGMSPLFNLAFQLGNVFSAKPPLHSSEPSLIMQDRVSEWMTNNAVSISISFLIVLLLLFVLLYFSHTAKASLILAVDNTEDDKSPSSSFIMGIKSGQPFAWKLWGMSLLLRFGLVVCICALAAPLLVGGFKAVQSSATWAMVMLVIAVVLFLLIVLVALLCSSVVLKLSERILVLEDKRIIESLKSGFQLVRVQIGKSLLTYLIAIGVSFLWSIALIASLFIAALVLVPLGFLAFTVLKTAGATAYTLLVTIGILLALFVCNGAYTVLLSGYWTLSYKALVCLADKSE